MDYRPNDLKKWTTMYDGYPSCFGKYSKKRAKCKDCKPWIRSKCKKAY